LFQAEKAKPSVRVGTEKIGPDEMIGFPLKQGGTDYFGYSTLNRKGGKER